MSPETYEEFIKDLKIILDKYKYDITHFDIEFSPDDEIEVTIETNIQRRNPRLSFIKRSKEENEKDPSGRNVSVKFCNDCKYNEYNINTEPCFSCFSYGDHESWEPKEVDDGT